MPWQPTELWRPGRPNTASGGKPMRCSETGALGFCKPTDVAQEKICADLARAVGVNVPEVRLGEATGIPGTVAVSIVFGKESQDIAMVRQQLPDIFNSEPVKTALRAASGLLAFHAWVGTGDLKDDHVLSAVDGTGAWSIAAIDFASALAWRSSDAPAPAVTAPSAPQALIENVDAQSIGQVVERIEHLTDLEISQIMDTLPNSVCPLAERSRITKGLLERRSQVGAAMKAKGWIP